ncbi:unnamed protein product [Allacma fusca]|uniref:C2H2-type domain-containing protein n=1 Tax=Allacma fusca TaxID=39272 RepID=A0A8J2P7U4_9HEXA|nr:unnamed protein product [Allacma fusca]
MGSGTEECGNICSLSEVPIENSPDETGLPCCTTNDYFEASGENPSCSEGVFCNGSMVNLSCDQENIVRFVKTEIIEHGGTESIDPGQDSDFSDWEEPNKESRRKLVKNRGFSSKRKSQHMLRITEAQVNVANDNLESVRKEDCSTRVTRSGKETKKSAGVTRSKTKAGKEESTCSYCGAYCGCPSRLRDHMRKHTGERPFQCDDCGKKFVTLPVLRRHAKEHNEHKPYSCSICNKSFAAKSNLLGHMRLHDRKNTVLCSLCGKAYRNQTDLKIHERSHTAFAAQVDVRSHMRSHPIKDLPLKCYICSYDCPTTEVLSDHLETHSQKKKSLQCEICGRVSRNQSEFDIHLRRHTGEKPFHCHCGKSFVSNVILRKHKRRHSDEKPYQCEVCPKRFAAMADMKSHLRSHPAKKLQESILRFNLELLGQYRQEEDDLQIQPLN